MPRSTGFVQIMKHILHNQSMCTNLNVLFSTTILNPSAIDHVDLSGMAGFVPTTKPRDQAWLSCLIKTHKFQVSRVPAIYSDSASSSDCDAAVSHGASPAGSQPATILASFHLAGRLEFCHSGNGCLVSTWGCMHAWFIRFLKLTLVETLALELGHHECSSR